jgi:hypothetical protein
MIAENITGRFDYKIKPPDSSVSQTEDKVCRKADFVA